MEIPIKMWKFSWGYMENQNLKVEALTGNSNKDKAKDSEETRRELSVNIGLSFIREHTNTSVRLVMK